MTDHSSYKHCQHSSKAKGNVDVWDVVTWMDKRKMYIEDPTPSHEGTVHMDESKGMGNLFSASTCAIQNVGNMFFALSDVNEYVTQS